MALVMVLLVLILTLSFFYLKCTTMQSLVMLWSSVVSTMIAFSFYEQLADMLIARGLGPTRLFLLLRLRCSVRPASMLSASKSI